MMAAGPCQQLWIPKDHCRDGRELLSIPNMYPYTWSKSSQAPYTVEQDIFISEYFHYSLEMTFRLSYIFVF